MDVVSARACGFFSDDDDSIQMDTMQTHAFRMKLKPGTSSEYRRRHDEIWPELVTLLHEAGIRDYSIFLDEETLHLFAVLKLTADHQCDSLPQHPVMQRWWTCMADLMETQPDNRPREWPLVPMFHLG